jgi:energy-coupling factor transport system ATP-binding protein
VAGVAFEDLSFAYPGASSPALSHVSFSVPSGSWLLVAGASGSGKTTLLRHLVPGLLPHGSRSGRATLGSEDLASLEPGRRVGFVAQDPAAQMVCDEVAAELAFGLENAGAPSGRIRLRVAEMAAYFGLEPLLHRRCDELSGGQKQLVNLAAVLTCDPEVLVLDEPTAQLDPVAAAGLLAAVARVVRDLGTTVVMSEHRLEEALPLVSHVLVLEDGRVGHAGAPAQVASWLLSSGRDLACALPAAARAAHALGDRDALPLTVGEGRAWLAGRRGRCGAAVPSDLPAAAPELAEKPLSAAAGARGSRVFSAASVAVPAGVRREPYALELRDVWFRYAKDAPDVLAGLDLVVERGSVHAVLGGNGAGKSTLLRVACGLARPVRGAVRVEGARLDRPPRARAEGVPVALLPQTPRDLLTCETVRLDLLQMPAASDAGAFDRVVGECGVAHLLDRDPYDLSGGEAQRVALAKVLLARPRVLLLDEPTKGVDAAAKRRLARTLSSLADQGAAVVLVTHDVEFCAAAATRVSLLFDGSVALTAATRDFFAQAGLYATAAGRLARGFAPNVLTVEDLVDACR